MHRRAVAGVVAVCLLLSCADGGDDTARTADPGGTEEATAGQRELPPVAEVGAEMPLPGVTASLTSEVQEGWTIDVRGVARGPGEVSTLLLDITRDGGEGDWPGGLSVAPEALEVEGERRRHDRDGDLDGLSVVVPAPGDWRYGVLSRDRIAASASDAWPIADGETMPAFALLPGLKHSVEKVTVLVPTFGEVRDVPVVEVAERTSDQIPATIRLRGREEVRLDVVGLGRQGGGRGTLLQARLVDESAPGTPAGFPTGEVGLCDVRLLDTAMLRSYEPARAARDDGACVATTGEVSGPDGSQQVYEVLFPDLPDDVENVSVGVTGFGPSLPIPVEEEATEPWLLGPPDRLGEPVVVTLLFAVGPARGWTSMTEDEGRITVTLATDALFEADSAELAPSATALLRDVGMEISMFAARGGSVTITGHTDDVGDEAHNQRLSEERAEAVRTVLEGAVAEPGGTTYGRPDLSFEVTGRGGHEPIAHNSIGGVPNPDGRARNRRVTVVYTPAGPLEGRGLHVRTQP